MSRIFKLFSEEKPQDHNEGQADHPEKEGETKQVFENVIHDQVKVKLLFIIKY